MVPRSGIRGQSLAPSLLNAPCDLTSPGQGLCSHSLPRIPFTLLSFYHFGYSLVILFLPTYLFQLCRILFQMGRGAGQHSECRVKMMAVIFLFLLLHILPGQRSYCIILPFLSQRLGAEDLL